MDQTQDNIEEDIKKLEKDKAMSELKQQIGELLANNNLIIGAVIFTTKDSDEPQIMRKGHFYDVAATLHHVLSAYRAKASVELGI